MRPAGFAEAPKYALRGAVRAQVFAATVPVKGAAGKHRVRHERGAMDSPAVAAMAMMRVAGRLGNRVADRTAEATARDFE